MKKITSVLSGAVAAAIACSAFAADSNALPGDHGRPGGDGVMRVNPQGGPPPSMPPAAAPVAAPPIDVALKAAQAIAQGCHQYKLGVAVVNADGVPILTYVPDGSDAWHTYTAIRKAFTAVTYKVPTSELVTKAQQDQDFASQIKANPNLIAFKGGIPLKMGGNLVGAIGVSGAEPGGHDEECGLIGMAAIKDQLK